MRSPQNADVIDDRKLYHLPALRAANSNSVRATNQLEMTGKAHCTVVAWRNVRWQKGKM